HLDAAHGAGEQIDKQRRKLHHDRGSIGFEHSFRHLRALELSKSTHRLPEVIALYVAPLCPAGHLPHEGGDQPSVASLLVLQWLRWAKSVMKSDLPPRGGDVRQDRGGREGSPSSQQPTAIQPSFRPTRSTAGALQCRTSYRLRHWMRR